MRNLKVVIIDEISMVKSDMLYQLDLRLQEIMEKVGVPFEGVFVWRYNAIKTSYGTIHIGCSNK